MAIITVEIITSHDPKDFKKKVNEFLDKNEEMIFHDKTTYGITHYSQIVLGPDGYEDFVGTLSGTQYSVIFQLEGIPR